jgi:DNA-binding transcriptional ArsR family regulator
MNEEHCDLICLTLPRAEALRGRRLSAEDAQNATLAARALGDPTRFTLAAFLHEGGELCVCDLAWLTGRAINLVSHHLKVLRSGEVVSARREGKLVLYALTPRGRALIEAFSQPTMQEVTA